MMYWCVVVDKKVFMILVCVRLSMIAVYVGACACMLVRACRYIDI